MEALGVLSDQGMLALFAMRAPRPGDAPVVTAWCVSHAHSTAFDGNVCCRSVGCAACVCTLPATGSEASQQHWPDALSTHCSSCTKEFGLLTRRHHCRGCGSIACSACLDPKKMRVWCQDGWQPQPSPSSAASATVHVDPAAPAAGRADNRVVLDRPGVGPSATEAAALGPGGERPQAKQSNHSSAPSSAVASTDAAATWLDAQAAGNAAAHAQRIREAEELLGAAALDPAFAGLQRSGADGLSGAQIAAVKEFVAAMAAESVRRGQGVHAQLAAALDAAESSDATAYPTRAERAEIAAITAAPRMRQLYETAQRHLNIGLSVAAHLCGGKVQVETASLPVRALAKGLDALPLPFASLVSKAVLAAAELRGKQQYQRLDMLLGSLSAQRQAC